MKHTKLFFKAMAAVVFAALLSCTARGQEEELLIKEPVWNSSLNAFTLVGNTPGAGSRIIPALLKIEFLNGKTALDFPLDYNFEDDPDALGADFRIDESVYIIPAWNAIIPDNLNYLLSSYSGDPNISTVPQTTLEETIFKGWGESSSSAATINEVQRSSFGDSKRLSVFAIWEDGGDAVREALRNAIIAADNAMNTRRPSQYDDEFYIGNGAAESEDPSAQALAAEYSNYVTEANLLLEGMEKTEIVEIDGYDPSTGEQLKEEIHYKEYDYKRMAAIKYAIEQITANPLFSAVFIAPVVQTFEYAASAVRSLTITSPGTYEMELWGASGGHLWSKNDKTATGGKGAHLKGRVSLATGDVLKIRVGGEGVGSANYTVGGGFSKNSRSQQNPGGDGGWNGGGAGANSSGSTYTGGSGGGGASDIRYIGTYSAGTNNKQNGVNKTNNGAGVESGAVDYLGTRIIVAGGGGGAGQSAGLGGSWPGLTGGNAGSNGLIKGDVSPNGTAMGVTSCGNYLYSVENKDSVGKLAWYGLPIVPAGGTAAAAVGDYTASVLGIGGKGARHSSLAEGPGGGGGGYYGGRAVNASASGSGGGGSSYVKTDGSKPVTQIGNTDLNEYYGNGKIVIRFIQ